MNEGTTWESALLANKLNLGNLVCLIDRNRIQSLQSTETTLPLEPLGDKWKAFGWEVWNIDGHDFSSMSMIDYKSEKPKVVIAETVKGKGVPWMENQVLWHYKWPNSEELADGIEHLKSKTT